MIAIGLHDPDELDRLRKFIYRQSGMFVGPEKDYFLKSRVMSRMDALSMDRFTDYFRYLVLDPTQEEARTLINCVTVNETYFFRDYGQLTGFAEEVLPEVVDSKKRQSDDSIRMLSAGCSTGEEAYTLAIIAREMVDDPTRWMIRVDGVDINTQVLDHAGRAVYGTRSTKDVPTTYRHTYFENADAGQLKVRPLARNLVHFEYGNIYDPAYMSRFHEVDVVFCRNVLIYFDDDSRRRVLNNLYNVLRPGGYIFLGHAESVSRYTGAFEMIRLDNIIVHRRPFDTASEGES